MSAASRASNAQHSAPAQFPHSLDILARVVGLERLADELAQRNDEPSQWAARMFRTLFASEAKDKFDAEAALGLPSGWRKVTALLRPARRFPGRSVNQVAKQVAVAAGRYQRNRWRKDKETGCRPEGLDGELFILLSLGDIPGHGVGALTSQDCNDIKELS